MMFSSKASFWYGILVSSTRLMAHHTVGVDLGYVFSEKSGMKQALAGVKNLIVFSNEKNDGIVDSALVLPLGTSLEKWGDSEATLGIHSISQAE